MGEFLLKSHHSAKLLDPNRVCKQTLTNKANVNDPKFPPTFSGRLISGAAAAY
jgi:hypothetical protein